MGLLYGDPPEKGKKIVAANTARTATEENNFNGWADRIENGMGRDWKMDRERAKSREYYDPRSNKPFSYEQGLKYYQRRRARDEHYQGFKRFNKENNVPLGSNVKAESDAAFYGTYPTGDGQTYENYPKYDYRETAIHKPAGTYPRQRANWKEISNTQSFAGGGRTPKIPMSRAELMKTAMRDTQLDLFRDNKNSVSDKPSKKQTSKTTDKSAKKSNSKGSSKDASNKKPSAKKTDAKTKKTSAKSKSDVKIKRTPNNKPKISRRVPKSKSLVRQGTKALTKIATKEVAKRGTREVAKIATKEVARQGTKEVAKRGTKEVAKRGTKEAAKKGTDAVARQGTKEVAKRGTGAVSKWTAGKAVGKGVGSAMPSLGPLFWAYTAGDIMQEGTRHQYNSTVPRILDPSTNTTSQVSDYTNNPNPGQQVGTGMNTGTQPEYNTGFRYNPTNIVASRYNAVKDYMEAPKASGPAAAPMTVHNGPGGSTAGASQQGYTQSENKDIRKWHNGRSVNKDNWGINEQTGLELLGIDTNNTEDVRRLQSFLLNSGYDIGEFGEGGLDGKFGNMTRGATADFLASMASEGGMNKLTGNSTYLNNMRRASLGSVGGRASNTSEAFAQSVASAIQNADPNSWSTDVRDGTVGRGGQANGGINYDVVAGAQAPGTSNADANAGFSNIGAGVYENSQGQKSRTRAQNPSYKKGGLFYRPL